MDADTIRIVALGDFFLGGEFLNHAQKKRRSLLSPFEEISPFIAKSDILVINLEGPLYNNGKKRPGVTAHLNNHRASLDWFSQSPNVVVNLANNHILDYGNDDFSNTVRLLHENNIQTIGAGVDVQTAYKPALLNIDAKSIAFVAYTTDEPHVGSIIVGADKPGCASLSDFTAVTRQLRNLKLKADYLVVVLHWGFEYFLYPAPRQVELAHKLVDAGADLIIGHHPHVLQGIENYNDAFILYSLGNFFFPQFRDINGRLKYQKYLSKEFLIAAIDINGHSGKHKLSTYGGRRKNDYRLQFFDGSNNKIFQKKIDNLSASILSPDYPSFWNHYSEKRTRELEIESLKEVFIRIFTRHPNETIGKLKVTDLNRNLDRIRNFFFR